MSMTGLLSAFGTKFMDPFRNTVSTLVKLRTYISIKEDEKCIFTFFYMKNMPVLFFV